MLPVHNIVRNKRFSVISTKVALLLKKKVIPMCSVSICLSDIHNYSTFVWFKNTTNVMHTLCCNIRYLVNITIVIIFMHNW